MSNHPAVHVVQESNASTRSLNSRRASFYRTTPSRGARFQCWSLTICILLGMSLSSANQAAEPESSTTNDDHDKPKLHMGVPQNRDGSEFGISQERIQVALDDRQDYLVTKVLNVLSPAQIERCKDFNENCLLWGLQNECHENEDFMDQQCALSCHVCDKVLPDEELCFYVDSGPDIWQPGDLDRMFRRIVDDPKYHEKYKLQVLSSPDDKNNNSSNDDETDNEEKTSEIPWVLVLDDFITPEEANRLIELGALEGYDTSTLADREDEEDDRWRTSTNSWCQENCHGDEVYESVMQRMVDMTSIPKDYAEDMQMLRYQPGQFYKVHHDYVQNEDMSQKGCRMLTVFLYLNDVEQGGSTVFPELNLTVTPKTGRALIWPSVLNEDPRAINWGTEHEAQVVEKGEKYGANVWFHIKPLQKAWTQFECCETRKTFGENGPLVWEEGDLNAMFQRIVNNTEYMEAYNTTILSSPDTDGPWVVTLRNFITPEEAATLVELGAEQGYEDSTLGMEATRDDSTRSSMHTFCEGECEQNEVAEAVMGRIVELTQISEEYTEFMQLLKYETGQFYDEHHDYDDNLDEEMESQVGNRVLTVYIYLNDVEKGGETAFPKLDLVVSPEVGKVIIWPSVFDESPMEMDERTRHEARPVIAGNKFGANVWFRYRPFRTAWRQPMCADEEDIEVEQEGEAMDEAQAEL